MNKINFYEIELSETRIYKADSSLGGIFRRFNITNVGQILDDNLMNEILKHCRSHTRTKLCFFISLLKYKYLEIPLPTNDILSEKVTPLDSSSLLFTYFRQNYDDETADKAEETFRNKIKRLQYDIEDANLVPDKSSSEYIKIQSSIDKRRNELDNLKMIDLIKEAMSDLSKRDSNRPRAIRCIEVLTLLVESWEKSQKLKLSINKITSQPNDSLSKELEYDALTILKKHLHELINVRDNLNTQIEDLQQKINELSKTNTEGGANK